MALLGKLWTVLILLSYQISNVTADSKTNSLHSPVTRSLEAGDNSIASSPKSIQPILQEGTEKGQKENIESQREPTGTLNSSPLVNRESGEGNERRDPHIDRIGSVGSGFQAREPQQISLSGPQMLTVDGQEKTGLDSILEYNAPIQFPRRGEDSDADISRSDDAGEIDIDDDADDADEERNYVKDVNNKMLAAGEEGEGTDDVEKQVTRLDENVGAGEYDGRIDTSYISPSAEGGLENVDTTNIEGINRALPDFVTNDDSLLGRATRRFDSIGNNRAFAQFGKKSSNVIDGKSALPSNNKRRFDSIGNSAAFSNFGKRRFDSIGNSAAFSNFGKRRFDSIGNSAFANFGKRKFDSIGDSAFRSFGKRRFDSIGDSAFRSFGKRRFDSIDNSAAFSNFGKRRFDSIGNSAAFSNFGKRRFDSIGNSAAFSNFGKRRFDSIGNSAAFSNFGKRRFDSIGNSAAFSNFGKRRFDSIGNSAAFSNFGKRRFDSIGNSAAFSNFGKRKFDRIDNSAFASFGKRRFDSIGDSGFRSFGKRRFDSIGDSGFRSFGKRRFDSIGNSAAFSNFGKRDQQASGLETDGHEGQQSNHLSTLSRKRRDAEQIEDVSGDKKPEIRKRDIDLNNLFDDANVDLKKRSFDSIDGRSSFRRFGRSQETDALENYSPLTSKRRFDSISSKSDFGLFGKRAGFDVKDGDEFMDSFRKIMNPIRGSKSNDILNNNIAIHDGLAKRRFDKIGYSNFASFGKKRFDPNFGASGFGSYRKRVFDSIHHKTAFTGFGKRRLDSIGGGSFSKFGKRSESSDPSTDVELMGLLSLLNDLDLNELKSLGIILDGKDPQLSTMPSDSRSEPSGSVAKRRFDSIDHMSAFRRFGRYNGRPSTSFSLVPDYNSNYPTLSARRQSDDLVRLLSKLHRYVVSLEQAAKNRS